MADSDGSDSHKHRDKFRRERNDNDNRGRLGGKREPFDERRENGYGGRRPMRDRYSPEEPVYKRRRDDNYRGRDSRDDDIIYRTPMMPFKRFLEPLDDYIKDDEAFSKYQVYKEDFNRRQVEDYFETHKDEEWLREKYHPEKMDQRKEIIQRCIKTRLDVFLDLFEKGFIDGQAVQMDNSESLIQLMDAVVIKLCGGGDDDLEEIQKTTAVPVEPSEEENKCVNECESEPVHEPENVEETIEKPIKTDEDSTETAPVIMNEKQEDVKIKTEEETKSQSRTASDASSESGCGEESDNDVPTPTTAEAPFPPSMVVEKASTVLAQPSMISPPYHKTASIFFRNLPACVTKAELEELCKLHEGFIRLSLWDPSPERKFTRNAWATYRHDVPIKKICWALNTSSLIREKLVKASGSNTDITVTVNRELTQRVRPVMPLTRHREVMRQDLIYAAKLVAMFDSKHDLWNQNIDDLQPEEEIIPPMSNSSAVPDLPGTYSANPLMRNLSEYLGGDIKPIENEDEAHHLLNPIKLTSDVNLARVLDRLIIYLRIVHSFDFYAVTNYVMEDSMPHKCGILHARGDRGLSVSSPTNSNSNVANNVPTLMFSKREMDDYMKGFSRKMEPFLKVACPLIEEQMKLLGARDIEKAADDFIKANTQKRISKNKPYKVVWVCPLSDKKFREPMFVEKHILNKHAEKVEMAKKDALFFNNYIRDSDRPCLPDPPRHLMDQYYPPTTGGNESRSRRISSPRGRYGGHMGPNNRGPMGNRYNRYQDYYDRNTQQQAMAAVAAAAAAALYPSGSNPMDILGKNALAGLMGGNRGAHRGYHNGSGPHGNRPGGRGGNNDRYNRRGMVSYNDLDDPNNEDF